MSKRPAPELSLSVPLKRNQARPMAGPLRLDELGVRAVAEVIIDGLNREKFPLNACLVDVKRDRVVKVLAIGELSRTHIGIANAAILARHPLSAARIGPAVSSSLNSPAKPISHTDHNSDPWRC